MANTADAPAGKPYGIAVSLPENDPLSASHLLGDGWCSVRWFASAEERAQALSAMQQQPAFYRQGDTPSVSYELIDP